MCLWLKFLRGETQQRERSMGRWMRLTHLDSWARRHVSGCNCSLMVAAAWTCLINPQSPSPATSPSCPIRIFPSRSPPALASRASVHHLAGDSRIVDCRCRSHHSRPRHCSILRCTRSKCFMISWEARDGGGSLRLLRVLQRAVISHRFHGKVTPQLGVYENEGMCFYFGRCHRGEVASRACRGPNRWCRGGGGATAVAFFLLLRLCGPGAAVTR